MTRLRAVRLSLVTVVLAGLAALLVAALAELPGPDAPPPRSAQLSTSVVVHERHVTNTVAGVTFDLRALDTLGEELILFAAAGGVSLLLRGQRTEKESERARESADARREELPAAVRATAAILVGPLLVFGAYIVSHGQMTPGGGFQGGVIIAAVLLLAYAGGQMLATGGLDPTKVLELLHALGAAAFGLVALAGVIFAGVALTNVVALGITGHLLSGGTILILEVVVGVGVAAATTLIFSELLDQALLQRS